METTKKIDDKGRAMKTSGLKLGSLKTVRHNIFI